MEREGKTFKVGLRKHFKNGSNSITWVCNCGTRKESSARMRKEAAGIPEQTVRTEVRMTKI